MMRYSSDEFKYNWILTHFNRYTNIYRTEAHYLKNVDYGNESIVSTTFGDHRIKFNLALFPNGITNEHYGNVSLMVNAIVETPWNYSITDCGINVKLMDCYGKSHQMMNAVHHFNFLTNEAFICNRFISHELLFRSNQLETLAINGNSGDENSYSLLNEQNSLVLCVQIEILNNPKRYNRIFPNIRSVVYNPYETGHLWKICNIDQFISNDGYMSWLSSLESRRIVLPNFSKEFVFILKFTINRNEGELICTLMLQKSYIYQSFQPKNIELNFTLAFLQSDHKTFKRIAQNFTIYCTDTTPHIMMGSISLSYLEIDFQNSKWNDCLHIYFDIIKYNEPHHSTVPRFFSLFNTIIPTNSSYYWSSTITKILVKTYELDWKITFTPVSIFKRLFRSYHKSNWFGSKELGHFFHLRMYPNGLQARSNNNATFILVPNWSNRNSENFNLKMFCNYSLIFTNTVDRTVYETRPITMKFSDFYDGKSGFHNIQLENLFINYRNELRSTTPFMVKCIVEVYFNTIMINAKEDNGMPIVLSMRNHRWRNGLT
ncbi:hypothetical protein RDWZM_010263 [Blomia tropicalis]|uniref:Uncharacterized protein n=1 Tax=Blomia tropicalis TaxID=40697 RepID=A0A9Q0LWF7_BLOTA|nr:hypothetical protein RDWZM_010263 [Blomia tropicalis]